MTRVFAVFALAAALAAVGGPAGVRGQEKRTGTVTGLVKSKKDTPNGKNVVVEVLAAGEEKPRPYRVQYDPKVKGPIPEVLKAVRAAAVGDTAEFDWVDTGEGLAIKKFQVLKKAGGAK